ncbi:hypothetical protein HYW87_02125, partial [Candidatus Roizmanbacteria bacterium]|nr:hypothetical protein [Candidatus Roizmanbacteria bacterium]
FVLRYVSAELPSRNFVLYGFLFGFAGLLLNAGYIDVFEASKVAYTFWTVAGLFIGFLESKHG